MKRADISARLFNKELGMSWHHLDEIVQMPSYQGDIADLERDIYKVAFDNISFLSRLDLYVFSEDEIPSIYVLYDASMTLLECVSFQSFISWFVVTDHYSNYMEGLGCCNCISNGNYEALCGLHRSSANSLLGDKAIDAVRYCNSNAKMYAFFFKLMAVSARMAAITGDSNVYNDYRLNNDLHALFAHNVHYDARDDRYIGAAYVFATAKYMQMQKSRTAYENDFRRGDLKSIGITPDTPIHLWKKMSERDYYAASKHHYTPPQPEPATQTPQIWPRVQHPWGYPQPHMPCPVPQAPTVGFNLPF